MADFYRDFGRFARRDAVLRKFCVRPRSPARCSARACCPSWPSSWRASPPSARAGRWFAAGRANSDRFCIDWFQSILHRFSIDFNRFYCGSNRFCIDFNRFQSVLHRFLSILHRFQSILLRFLSILHRFSVDSNRFYIGSNRFCTDFNRFCIG